jgi:hypothetical protein
MWTPVSGATQYNFVLYKGTTQVYSKTASSSVCSTTTCSSTPSEVLPNDAYTWNVRAYISGAWGTPSSSLAFSVTDIPTPVSPTGVIKSVKPTFTWSRIDGVTQYNLVLYQGTKKIYSITVPNSSCGSSLTDCSITPGTLLKSGTYSWKVRAYISGAWKAYSAAKSFNQLMAFDSTFTSTSSGWNPVHGTWGVGGGYFQAIDQAGYFASSAQADSYNILTYEVKMKRNGCPTCANGIYFNGTPSSLTDSGSWSNGYKFLYSNDGEFSLWEYINGTAYALVNWHSFTGISPTENILRVTYNSTTGFTQFYLNGVRLAYGKLTTFPSGQVGLTFYTDGTAGDKLYVDYARLFVTAPAAQASSSAKGVGFDDSAVPQAASGKAPDGKSK